MTHPFISVVIVAYKRTEFLMDAFKSVISQKIDSCEYEIIIVKHFQDELMDSFFLEHKAVLVHPNCQRLGSGIVEGIKLCKGEVIAFLDDDDIFLPEKLAVVERFFHEYPELGYYHNNHAVINKQGVASDEMPRVMKEFSKRQTFVVKHEYTINGDDKQNVTFKLERLIPDFNMSSVVIRKSIIIDKLSILGQLESAPDTFMYFASLVSDCALCVDSDTYTLYRIHGANTALGLSHVSLIEYRKRFLNSLEKIREMVVLQKNKNAIEAISFRIESTLISQLISTSYDKSRLFHMQISFLKFCRHFFSIYYVKKNFLMLLFYLSPMRTRAIYLKIMGAV